MPKKPQAYDNGRANGVRLLYGISLREIHCVSECQ